MENKKNVSTGTTGLLSIILMGVLLLFAVGQLLFCLISPHTVLGWIKNAHFSYYGISTASPSAFTNIAITSSFENLFGPAYIRIMSMYVFVLCLPPVYALLNLYFISQNGKSKKPFRSSTSDCLRSITLAFIVEFCFATVLYMIMKLIMRVLPFYFMYAMIAVAVYSVIVIILTMTFSGLINRMGTLRNLKKQERKRWKPKD